MNKLTENLAAKITAIVLSFIAFAVLISSLCGIFIMLESDGYSESNAEIKSDVLKYRIGNKHIYNILDLYSSGQSTTIYSEDQNIYYLIEDAETGGVIDGNYNGEAFLVKQQSERLTAYEERVQTDQYGNETIEEIEKGDLYITVYLTRESLSGRGKLLLDSIDVLYNLRFYFIVAAAVSGLIFFSLLCFLFAAQSHRKGGVIALNHLDKVPFDLLTGIVFTIACMSILVLDYAVGDTIYFIVFLCLVLSVDYFVALGYSLSFAARLKTHTLIKNNIMYICGNYVYKLLKKFFCRLGFVFKNLPTVTKTAAITGGIALFEFAVLASFTYLPFIRVALLFWFLALDTALVVSVAIVLKRIKEGGERIAKGDLQYKIDTKYMYGEFKSFAESLNNISDGLAVAVDEKMKSERFKTELITNVSHDIKTPLTSIINYVDLIKTSQPENENIKEYIDVLDRQSARLKKLIEDLVEASKASSGSLAVNLAPCNIGVLLSQTIGEFDEKFKKANITPILKTKSENVIIKADARHLWRVTDNLLNNICKYSQEGTRAYIDVAVNGGKVFITFKNVSKYELNISSEELMERFVRGDKSRHTEGSGLGLSIAKSLTELQNGSMEIEVDGDLFKVVLCFDTEVE